MDDNGVPDTSVNLFGLCIPGRDVLTNFIQVDDNMVTLMIEAPKYVAELSFFLLPGCVLPDDQGALLYYSVGPAFAEWQVLGAIANGRSSGIFRTGWPTNDSIDEASIITLGVRLEDIAALNNLDIGSQGVENRINMAQHIANDLYNFLSSFVKDTSTPGTMEVPTNAFDAWMETIYPP